MVLKSSSNTSDNLIYLDHHLIKNNRLLCLQKLDSKELYSIITLNIGTIPTSQKYFECLFPNSDLDWNVIYILPRLVTQDTQLRAFQYKILNNILYLNKKLFHFGDSETPLCSFCNNFDETPKHVFAGCTHVIENWSEMKAYLSDYVKLPQLTP